MPTARVIALAAGSRRRLLAQSALCGAAAMALSTPVLAGGPVMPTQTSSGANLAVSSTGTLTAKTSSGTGGATYSVNMAGTAATITLGQPRTLIDWTTYEVGSGGQITYDFGSATGAASDLVINRVTTGTISIDAGGAVFGQYHSGATTLTGGNIWFLAPGGVFIHGTVTAGGVLASNNVAIPDTTLLDTSQGLAALKQQLASYNSTAYSVADISGGTVTTATGGTTVTGTVSATGVEIDAAGNINLTTKNETAATSPTTSAITTASSDGSDYVALTSTGAITQLTSGVITTSTFTGSSVGATSLPGSNLIGALASFDAGGSLSVTNAQSLTVSGTVEAGTGGTSGDLAISLTSGSLSGTGTLEALGDIALTSLTGGLGFGSAAAGDDIVIRTPGALAVTGALTSGINPYDATPTAGADTGATGAGDVLAKAEPLTLFGKTVDADLTGGGAIDISASTVSVGGAVTAGLTGATTGDNVWVLATGLDTLHSVALKMTGAVSATQDVGLDATSGGVNAAATTAGQDIAVQSVKSSVILASASAGDDLVVRAFANFDANGDLVAGTAGKVVDGAGAGLGDTLAASAPLSLFGKVADASLTAGGDVDVKARYVIIGGSVTAGVAGKTTADSVWILAEDTIASGTPLEIDGSVSATQDVGLESNPGSLRVTGAVTAGRDIAAQSILGLGGVGDVTLGSASAGDDVVLRARSR
jgi:hypothetical protein